MAVYQLLSLALYIQGNSIVDSTESQCLWLSQSGDCGECHFGWYGAYCDRLCQNCDTGGCHKTTGVCLQCRAGYYSTNCSLTCPPQCRESYSDRVFCDRTTGNCLEGCKQTWWGDKCEHKCGKQCSDSICFFYDGSCANGCENGLTGAHCNKSCSVGCLGVSCSHLSGVCLRGCKIGYFERSCDRRCSEKCIGSDCSAWNDGDKPTCTVGCVPGWKPPFCDSPCPPNCLSCTEAGVCKSCRKGFTGSSCEKRCNCRSGCNDDKLCDGCTDGWWGQSCELTCFENCAKCQQDSGNCTTCRQNFTHDDGRSQCIFMIHDTTTAPTQEPTQKSLIAVAVTVTIVPLLIIPIGIYVIYRRRRFEAVFWNHAKDEQHAVHSKMLPHPTKTQWIVDRS